MSPGIYSLSYLVNRYHANIDFDEVNTSLYQPQGNGIYQSQVMTSPNLRLLKLSSGIMIHYFLYRMISAYSRFIIITLLCKCCILQRFYPLSKGLAHKVTRTLAVHKCKTMVFHNSYCSIRNEIELDSLHSSHLVLQAPIKVYGYRIRLKTSTLRLFYFHLCTRMIQQVL